MRNKNYLGIIMKKITALNGKGSVEKTTFLDNKMSSTNQRKTKKSRSSKWALLIIMTTYLSIALSLIVSPYWGFLFPITFFIIIIVQLVSTYFSVEKKDSLGNKIREEGAPLPDLPTNCYNCGTKLKNPEFLKFCEECGVKLK